MLIHHLELDINKVVWKASGGLWHAIDAKIYYPTELSSFFNHNIHTV